MKLFQFFLIITALYLFFSCKEAHKQEEVQVSKPTILESIAQAHGYKNWQDIRQISFTFNVDKSANHFQRSWRWRPKTNDITYTTMTDTLHYNRTRMDSLAKKKNAGFSNDRFWLLAPFNLIWDSNNFTHEHQIKAIAPISKKTMGKLTIVYGPKGGYTPGDAYDFYFGDDFMIREWVFRKGNQDDPSMTTTWEKYKDTLGIKIATAHISAEADLNIYFDGLWLEK